MQILFKKSPVYIFVMAAVLLIIVSYLFVPDIDLGLPRMDKVSGTDSSTEIIPERARPHDGINPDEISINDIMQPIEDLGPINSILIHQNGDLVAENYFRGMHAERTNNIKSASKSILSILIGIAIDKGFLESVDQKIGEFFPDYFETNPDPAKASITIEDLLTMRAGLQSTSGRNYGRWVTSNHWIHYVLNRPLVGVPGEDRIYSTGTTHLLSVILSRATGMNTRSFANQYLFAPMDIHIGGWDSDPQGYYLGGNNMALRPSDMLKIGQLMMNVGIFNGRQIVSRNWVIRSIKPVTGRRENIDDYGYLWFRRMSGDNHVIYAWGNGGQYIKIIPELDTVIAITSQNTVSGNSRNYRRRLMATLDHKIIPYLAAIHEKDHL